MSPANVIARDIMINEVETITADVSVIVAHDMMLRRGIGHFPVVAEESSREIVGIVSDTDLLPYTIPNDPNYPRDAAFLKERLAMHKNVGGVMTPVGDLQALIFEEEQADSFLHKFYRSDQPAFNLLMVVNNASDQSLVGVISWIDILKQWSRFMTKDLANKLRSVKAVDIAIPLLKVPSLRLEDNDRVQAALRRRGISVHRHLPILAQDRITRLFHYNELLPYMPIDESELTNPRNRELNLTVANYFDRLRVTEISETHSVAERTIPQDLPVWFPDDGDSVIKRFLDKTVNFDWRDRMAGLLLQSPDGELTHLLNPFDVIEWLKKNLVRSTT